MFSVSMKFANSADQWYYVTKTRNRSSTEHKTLVNYTKPHHGARHSWINIQSVQISARTFRFRLWEEFKAL